MLMNHNNVLDSLLKRNSSLNLPYIAEAIAQLRGISTEEVIDRTEENAERLYRLRQ